MRIEQSFTVTRVNFVAEGDLTGVTRLFEPLVRRGVARSFRHYHALLARNVAAAGDAPHSEGPPPNLS